LKLVYIHQYFKTPQEGGAIRSYYVAKHMVASGWQVEMITAHNKSAYERKNIEGIQVHYLPVKYDNSFSYLRRMVSFVHFMILAIFNIRKVKNVDFCYATSTPLSTGIIALAVKKFLKIPYYFEVRDLWPEAPIQMGIIKNSLLKKWLFELERRIYIDAEEIIGLSPGISRSISFKTSSQKTHTIPNMSDCNFFVPEKKDRTLEDRFGTRGKFVVTYFGAHGRVNGLHYLLDTAEYCKNVPVKFLIVGRGAQREPLLQSAKRRKLKNLEFLDFKSKYGLRDILNVADSVYISFERLDVLKMSSPNKFFDGLAAGKLIILNTDGWLKRLVEKYECGFYVDHPSRFKKEIVPFIENPKLLQSYQHNARRLAMEKFEKDYLCDQLLQVLGQEKEIILNPPKAYSLTG